MRMPAVCKRCGTIFPSPLAFENCINLSISGCEMGICPNCGEIGHVLDGVFNVIGNTIELLNGPAVTTAALQRLARILKEAKKQNVSREDIAERIVQEAPEFSSLKSLLPKTRMELYIFIGLIFALIRMIINCNQPQDPPIVNVEQAVNLFYQNKVVEQPHLKQSQSSQVKKVGRNDRCPCGSGKKYKNCCIKKLP